MKKILKKIHLYLSLPLGIVITIVCLTGAILIFDDELLQLTYPERYYVEANGKAALPLTELVPMVNQQLDTNSVAGVRVYSDPNRSYVMTMEKGFRISIFVDPYTGEILGTYEFQKSFFFSVMRLHRWLMDDSRTWGKQLVGWSTLLFVVITITGLILWFPKNRKKLKPYFRISVRNGWRRFWNDLHIIGGMYAAVLLIVMALTGLMWSFPWYNNAVRGLFNAKQEGGRGGHGHGPQRGGGGAREKTALPLEAWDNAVARLKEKNDVKYIAVSANNSATVATIWHPHERASDRYTFDGKTGEITSEKLYADGKRAEKVMGWAYILHVGSWGGIIGKILTFIASLIGASLPLTGYYMYFKRIAKSRK